MKYSRPHSMLSRYIPLSLIFLLAHCNRPPSDGFGLTRCPNGNQACSSRNIVEEARELQSDIRRAIITVKSLGRFGQFAIFQEELEHAPCLNPISSTNRVCEVNVLEKGLVRLQVAEPALTANDQIKKNALTTIDYSTGCENIGFDFKTFDNVLPRGITHDGLTVWENRLVRVTHRRILATNTIRKDLCTARIEAAPQLLARIQEFPAIKQP